MKRITFHNLASAPQKAAPLALAFMCLTFQAVSSWAGPQILATTVTSQCAMPTFPGYSQTGTVSVQLNPVTSGFFGNQLVYYFTNTNTGQVFPFNGWEYATGFPLPVGNYTLVIKDPPVVGLGQSSSPLYTVTVSLCPWNPPPPPPIFPTPLCVKPPAGMNAWWTLDETTGNAHDLTGNLHLDGLRHGTSTVPGMVNKAAHFNGANDYVEVLSQPGMDVAAADNIGSGDMSIDAWVKADATEDTSGVRVIVEKRTFTSPSHYKGFSFYLYNGYLGLQLADDATAPGYANYGAPALIVQRDGAWHFVAVSVKRRPPVTAAYPNTITVQFTMDSSSFIVSSPALVGSLANSSPLRIGMRTIDNGGTFNGSIDEVEFFHRFVTLDEWQTIIGAGSAGKCRPSAMLP
jgi:hypothetical protein